jgi:hypothetical protein
MFEIFLIGLVLVLVVPLWVIGLLTIIRILISRENRSPYSPKPLIKISPKKKD